MKEKLKTIGKAVIIFLAGLLVGLMSNPSLNKPASLTPIPQVSMDAVAEGSTLNSTGLLFNDEFTGSAGIGPDPSLWTLKLTDEWQPAPELQTYTNSTNNAFLTGDGRLAIKAIAQGNNEWTSARLHSKQLFRYGLFSARIKVPMGTGTWGAFWMLGEDNLYGWPRCGEIDIMEAPMNPSEAGRIFAGTHQSNAAGNHVGSGSQVPYTQLTDLLTAYHTYSMNWQPGRIDFYVDQKLTGSVTRASIEAAGGVWLFDHQPQRIILNLAVGGWGGTPASWWTSQTMHVDWVRVYEG